jgi:Leucine-rich repeat (LRR) protein
MEVKTKGFQNTYQWFRNDVAVSDNDRIKGSKTALLSFTAVLPSDNGRYYCVISNPKAARLQLRRAYIDLKVQPKLNELDLRDLRKFYAALDGGNWKNKWNFEEANLGKWFGLTLENGRIVAINLLGNSLKGSLTEELFVEGGLLSELRELNISGNAVGGTIPISLKNLKKLRILDIGNNNFEGTIPVFLFELPLNQLYLNHNRFNRIPSNLPPNPSLRVLFLNNNRFEELPDVFFEMLNLEHLALQNNRLSLLSARIGLLKKLKILSLQGNLLKEIPKEICSLPSLIELNVASNQLKNLPICLSTLESLEKFTLFSNFFQFVHLESFLPAPSSGGRHNLKEIHYTPQAKIGEAKNLDINLGESITLSLPIEGQYNQYQWFKNGKAITDNVSARTAHLYLQNTSREDAGIYSLQITNRAAKELILYSNDLKLSLICGNALPVLIGVAGSVQYCQNEVVNAILSVSVPNSSYQWYRNGLPIGLQTKDKLNVIQTGKYNVQITDANNCSYFAKTDINVRTYEKTALKIGIEGLQLKLLEDNSLYNSFQWFADGKILDGVNTPEWKASQKGVYWLMAIDQNGCRIQSNPIVLDATGLSDRTSLGSLELYPNPVTHDLSVDLNYPTEKLRQMILTDLRGVELWRQDYDQQALLLEQIDLHQLVSGTYFLRVITDKQVVIRKISKE